MKVSTNEMRVQNKAYFKQWFAIAYLDSKKYAIGRDLLVTNKSQRSTSMLNESTTKRPNNANRFEKKKPKLWVSLSPVNLCKQKHERKISISTHLFFESVSLKKHWFNWIARELWNAMKKKRKKRKKKHETKRKRKKHSYAA